MTSLQDIRDALANQLTGITTISGTLIGYALQPPNPVFPCVILEPYAKSRAETFDGSRTYEMYLHVYTRANDVLFGQPEIQPLISDQTIDSTYGSIEDAIDADPTLNGVVASCIVLGWGTHPKAGGIVKGTIGGVTVFGWSLEAELITLGAVS